VSEFESWLQSRGVPTPTYVYVFYFDELALYVGISVNLRNRLYDHYRDARAFAMEATRIEVEEHPTEESARLREKELIEELVPVYNIAGQENVAAVVSYLRAKYATDGCAGLEAGVQELKAEAAVWSDY